MRMTMAMLGFLRSRSIIEQPPREKSTGTQVALLTFLIIPMFLGFLGGLIIWTDRITSIRIAHSIFIFVAILLPAGLYYYFISTKRESLLNAFLITIDTQLDIEVLSS